MTDNKPIYPSLAVRLYSVWYRHFRVYTQNLFSNGLPPFLEPLLFLIGVGLGLSKYVTESMDGLRYIEFLGTGLLMTSAMFTAAFECTYGSFIRLEYGKIYDAMLAAPVTVKNLVLGEIIWVGTKGLFFSSAVACILLIFRIIPFPECLPALFVGLLTGMMFGGLSLLVTSYVKTINHFNFFLTGIISPMFYFCGVVFPLGDLRPSLRIFAECLPLTHSVRLVRALCTLDYQPILLWDLLYIALFITLFSWLAVLRFGKRLVD